MLLLHHHPRFRALGWRLLLQIHDELICEGPEESVEEAMKLMVEVMEHPFSTPLRVALVVDAKDGFNWFASK